MTSAQLKKMEDGIRNPNKTVPEGFIVLDKIKHVFDKLDCDDRKDLLNFILDVRMHNDTMNNVRKKK